MGARVSSGSDSFQGYATPPDFMAAIHRRFGVPDFDLAATAKSTKAPYYYAERNDGPDCHGVNAFAHDWTMVDGLLWLNPPFADIAPWARKCAASKGARILLLVPAAVGSNWFRDHVAGIADVSLLVGRIAFDPARPKWGYPKDCILAHYGPQATGRMDIWTWRTERGPCKQWPAHVELVAARESTPTTREE